jgi:hypothetical protein
MNINLFFRILNIGIILLLFYYKNKLYDYNRKELLSFSIAEEVQAIETEIFSSTCGHRVIALFIFDQEFGETTDSNKSNVCFITMHKASIDGGTVWT